MQKFTALFLSSCSMIAALSAVPVSPAAAQEDYKAKYDQLKRDYDAVSADRENIIQQVKGLVESKAKCESAEAEINKATAARDAALAEAKKAQDQAAALANKLKNVENEYAAITRERDELKRTLDKMTLDYKIVPETQRENARLRDDLAAAQRNLKNLQIKSKRLEDQALNDSAQMEVYRRQIKEFKKRYELAMAKNRSLEKKIEQVPARFAEIARENKVLIKETALMHYNLGVFYTKNKEYSRAIAEFEKTVELNPNDAAAQYNLGFIYAEYLVNRPKALEHFRKFLSLVKSDDKDVDWVKKYILTWQTWEGKKPID
ncbi:MAG TPA: tetratricopeptide repeat protein [Candidatus Omnitrophota bacterium]|nr:tetratricopeptide repeat protein [Candidatus Omnitrophota bacterium]